MDMLHLMDSFIGHIREAIGFKIEPLAGVNSICLCGIGGSAMCGDILIDYLGPICDKQITVVRSVTLPRWVNRGTLIVVISYSGNTKEALDIFQDSTSKGLQTVCITSGGELLREGKGKERSVHTCPSWHTAPGGIGLPAGVRCRGPAVGGRVRSGQRPA